MVDIKEIIKKISYKPNWQFEVIETDDCIPFSLQIRINEADSHEQYHPFSSRWVNLPLPLNWAQWKLTDSQIEDMIIKWVREQITRIELHERDEWLKYDNKLIFDAHKNEDGSRNREIKFYETHGSL